MICRIIVYFILFSASICQSSAQITKYPYVESIDPNYKIESVEITNINTIISVIYTETHSNLLGPYVSFPSLTIMYLEKDKGVKIESLGEYQLDVKYRTEKGKSYRFRLFFEKLSPGIENITIRSFTTDQYGQKKLGDYWKGIQINNPLNITKTNWNESKLKEYITKDMKDPREGIYERVTNEEQRYKLGLVKDGENFKLIFLSSDQSNVLREGDLKADLFITANDNLFKASWINIDGSTDENVYITFKEFYMEVVNSDGQDTYLKLFPTAHEQTPQNHQYSTSGTGFLIGSEGYIVTNHHVIKDANKITVKGLNGDFSKSIQAKLVIEDINNDLAIIKTDEFQTPFLTETPYVISDKIVEPGNLIFCLGYPLRATMGEEVKVTNGIISSNSGFMGDISSYQITAPIQPGNSGGPLFDDKGNLIGIIIAKHLGAENVSYAVKSTYLLNLISSAPKSIKRQQINRISSLPLSEKIKSLKKYTYIIETR